MKRTAKLRAVEMVRRIRDKQARTLAGKSPEEVIAFFRRAGKASLQAAGVRRRMKVG
jgi:hypothetical protein